MTYFGMNVDPIGSESNVRNVVVIMYRTSLLRNVDETLSSSDDSDWSVTNKTILRNENKEICVKFIFCRTIVFLLSMNNTLTICLFLALCIYMLYSVNTK